MARYVYRAYDARGHESGGEIDATDLADALQALARQGLRPFDARPAVGSDLASAGSKAILARLPQSVTAQLVLELATLLSADLPLDETLRLAMLNQPKGRTRTVLAQVLDGVMAGASLSSALTSTQAVPPYVTDMIRAGEQAGDLAGVLDELARHLKRTVEIREKIASALVYPAVLMGMALIAVATILALLVPSLAGIFADANVTPPSTVRALLAIRDILTNDYPVVLILTAGIAFAAFALSRHSGVRLTASYLLLSAPFVGRLLMEQESAQLARVLGVQLRSGVPLIQALKTAIGLVRHSYLRQKLAGTADAVAQGSGLTRVFTVSGRLPPLLISLVRVGEETGRLEQMLFHAAQVFERKVERRLERVVGMITPVLTILIGAGVGSLVLGVMDAVLSINEMVLR